MQPMHHMNTLPHRSVHPSYITSSIFGHGTMRRPLNDVENTMPRSLTRAGDNTQYYYGWHIASPLPPIPQSQSPSTVNLTTTVGAGMSGIGTPPGSIRGGIGGGAGGGGFGGVSVGGSIVGVGLGTSSVSQTDSKNQTNLPQGGVCQTSRTYCF